MDKVRLRVGSLFRRRGCERELECVPGSSPENVLVMNATSARGLAGRAAVCHQGKERWALVGVLWRPAAWRRSTRSRVPGWNHLEKELANWVRLVAAVNLVAQEV